MSLTTQITYLDGYHSPLCDAAPDLLAACEEALECATIPGGNLKLRADHVINSLRSAISKAKT